MTVKPLLHFLCLLKYGISLGNYADVLDTVGRLVTLECRHCGLRR